ncbi:MAG: DUF6454 family protein [Agriterribacter sp.]
MIITIRPKYLAILYAVIFQVYALSAQQKEQSTIVQYLSNIQSQPLWHLTDSIPLNFNTCHTQGLTKAGNYFYLTSVKVNRWPQKYASPKDGFDRDNGDGIGYLFKFNENGKLVDSIRLGKDAVYHPGGIDFDGKYIWAPVCEYRPFGKSMIYRVNPETMQATLITTIPDAIGAVAYNSDANELIGMNWGSRVFYKWKINNTRNKTSAILLHQKGDINPHFYIDFQDCNYAGNGKMICAGLRSYKNAKGESIKLGGLELIDTQTYEAGLQLSLSEYTGKGVIVTNNPFYINITDGRLLCYFIPEDEESVLYIYHCNNPENLQVK